MKTTTEQLEAAARITAEEWSTFRPEDKEMIRVADKELSKAAGRSWKAYRAALMELGRAVTMARG